jgi:hypothetical protein
LQPFSRWAILRRFLDQEFMIIYAKAGSNYAI